MADPVPQPPTGNSWGALAYWIAAGVVSGAFEFLRRWMADRRDRAAEEREERRDMRRRRRWGDERGEDWTDRRDDDWPAHPHRRRRDDEDEEG